MVPWTGLLAVGPRLPSGGGQWDRTRYAAGPGRRVRVNWFRAAPARLGSLDSGE